MSDKAPFSPGYRPLVWTDETVSRFWLWQSRFPETYFTNLFGDRIARHLNPWLAGARTALDYGCGLGFFARHLAQSGLKVTAADFSPESVAIANDRNRDIAGFEGAWTVHDLVAQGRRFDRVLAIEVIEHLDESHLESFFDNLGRLMSDCGLAIITTPNEEDLRGLEIYCPCCDHVFHRYQHVRSFSTETLAKTVRAHGLEPLKIFATDLSRRSFWHPKQVAKDLIVRLTRGRRRPHLVCVAKRPG